MIQENGDLGALGAQGTRTQPGAQTCVQGCVPPAIARTAAGTSSHRPSGDPAPRGLKPGGRGSAESRQGWPPRNHGEGHVDNKSLESRQGCRKSGHLQTPPKTKLNKESEGTVM